MTLFRRLSSLFHFNKKTPSKIFYIAETNGYPLKERLEKQGEFTKKISLSESNKHFFVKYFNLLHPEDFVSEEDQKTPRSEYLKDFF